MVLFGAYHTAERFFDDDRLTSHFPGPGSYSLKSTVEGVPTSRYARKLVEDGGSVRPDGSAILFRERDCWVRGGEGPKGLTSLSAGNAFVSPATYTTQPGERAVKEKAPAAVVNTLESRYLSPSTRCLTPSHEREAKGAQSPGPGVYYPHEAWDFGPPKHWNRVNKSDKPGRMPSSRSFNAKMTWGEAAMPRPPNPAKAAQIPTKEERAWLSKRRGSARPSTAPRCMWLNGVSTRGGLQAWGDVATNTGPLHVGNKGNCASPWDRPTPRRGPDSQRRGPIHSREVRATSPGFRETRYLNRDLTRKGACKATDTPGPGQYSIRPPLERGTSFAGPRRPTKCSKAATVNALVASAKSRAASDEKTGGAKNGMVRGGDRQSQPSTAPSQRLSIPLKGRESPGPAYALPSYFDQKFVNKKTFHPPRCSGTSPFGTEEPSGTGRSANLAPRADENGNVRAKKTNRLPKARREASSGPVAKSGRADAIGRALGVPVNTCMGRGILLRIRADGMTFVRLPWGVLYTTEVLTHGGNAYPANPSALGNPGVVNSSVDRRGRVSGPTISQQGDRVDGVCESGED
ncbi:unnamed protein product [Ectocarpus sp. 8 AP-2014]